MERYDICFVGGGIASLYAAWKYLQRNPSGRLIVLEKEGRVGGRAHNVPFEGIQVPKGAGVGRYRKDTLLRRLMQDLDIPIKKFKSHHNYLLEAAPVDIKLIVAKLKRAALKYDRHSLTFREFAIRELGKETYQRFLQTCGYTDFENADFIDTLYHYGFDDTTDGGYMFYVPWNLLVEKLAERVGSRRIILNAAVHSISHLGYHGPIQVKHSNTVIQCDKVVLGTTVKTVRMLLPNVHYFNNKGVKSQSFLRVYAKINPDPVFQKKVPSYTLVGGKVQKIIPMQPQEGIYMIVYADNHQADYIQQRITSSSLSESDKCKYLEQTLRRAVRVPNIRIERVYAKYWEEGTHYYPPLPKEFKTRRRFVTSAQRPLPNIFIIGEMISMYNQGWTQGALESVHEVIDELC